jgi:hypothetical protein
MADEPIHTHKGAHNNLTAEQARTIWSYDPETGLLTWKIDPGRRRKPGDVAGWVQKGPKGDRLKVAYNNTDYMAHRVVWLIVTGEWPTHEVDHINEDATDNRWINLRAATSSQNLRNRGPQRNNTTGYKGVTYDKKRDCYIAGVKLNGYRHNLGTFRTPEDAYAAYCAKADELHGEFVKKK